MECFKTYFENWLESLKGPKATISSAIDTSGEILKRIPDLPILWIKQIMHYN